jgi:hypothetical protein
LKVGPEWSSPLFIELIRSLYIVVIVQLSEMSDRNFLEIAGYLSEEKRGPSATRCRGFRQHYNEIGFVAMRDTNYCTIRAVIYQVLVLDTSMR